MMAHIHKYEMTHQCTNLIELAESFATAPLCTEETDGADYYLHPEDRLQRNCDPGEKQPAEDMKASQEILQSFVNDAKENCGSPGPDCEQSCKRLFSATSETGDGTSNLYILMDNIHCSHTDDKCDEVEKWTHKFFDSCLFGTFKSKGLNAEKAYKANKGRGFHRALEYDPVVKSEYLSPTTDAGTSAGPCRPPEVKDLYEAPIFHGQFVKPRGNTLARIFKACGAPYAMGISGTIAAYMRVAAGQLFDSEKGPQKLMLLMAVTELGGHHTITELTLPVKHFDETLGTNFFTSVEPPFDTDGRGKCMKSLRDDAATNTQTGYYETMIFGLKTKVCELFPHDGDDYCNMAEAFQ